MDRVLKVEIPIPVNNKGEFDLGSQKEMFNKYKVVEQIKQKLGEKLNDIIKISEREKITSREKILQRSKFREGMMTKRQKKHYDKPISLYPLKTEEALAAFLKVDPKKIEKKLK